MAFRALQMVRGGTSPRATRVCGGRENTVSKEPGSAALRNAVFMLTTLQVHALGIEAVVAARTVAI